MNIKNKYICAISFVILFVLEAATKQSNKYNKLNGKYIHMSSKNDNAKILHENEVLIGNNIKQIYQNAFILNHSNHSLISSHCSIHIKHLKEGLNKLKIWALKMIDSSARFPSGILNGNINQYGDYDQCIGIREKNLNLKGKYCLTYIQPKVIHLESDSVVTEIINLIRSHNAFKSEFNDVGHRIPRFSLINWGICVPQSCTAKDVEYLLSNFFTNITTKSVLEFDYKVEASMCQTYESIDWNLSFSLVCSLLILIMLITSVSTVYEYSLTINKNQYLCAFSLRKNLFWLLKTKITSDDINVVHGIRFVNATMLLISHKSMAALFNPFVNRTFLAENLGQSWTVIGRTASLYTDPFLLISGLLTSYSIIGRLRKGNKIHILNEWITRLIRILPPVVFLMLICTFVVPKLSSGPQWNLVIKTHSNICKKNWWRLILFIQNYFGFSEMCLTHTHHLGIDTELFFISPIIVIALWKWPRRTLYALLLIIGLGTVGRFYRCLRYELANYIYFGVSIKQLFRTADLLYIFPPLRSSVYLMGILLGFSLQKFKTIQLTTQQRLLGWICTFFCAIATFTLPAHMANQHYKYNSVHASLYSAFAPLSWCSIFSWIIFVSHLRHENLITTILSWKGFQISTKLSYSVYLTQFPIFFFNVGRKRSADYYSNFYSIMIDLNEFCLILLCAFLLTLLIDAPFQNIKRILFKK